MNLIALTDEELEVVKTAMACYAIRRKNLVNALTKEPGNRPIKINVEEALSEAAKASNLYAKISGELW